MTPVFKEPVVVDACSLILLAKIGCLAELEEHFDPIHIPPEVVTECLRSPFAEAKLAAWLRDRKLEDDGRALIRGAGEITVIDLALRLGVRRIVSDDGPARKRAMKLGLVPIGTLGILVMSHRLGRLDGKEALTELLQNGFRADTALIKKYLESLNPDEA